MRRLRKKFFSVLLLSLVTMGILEIPMLKIQAFPSTLTTNNTLFMQKFQQWYDYVHYRYDANNIALNHANLTADEYSNALSRWTLAYHPLFCTFAYEKTGDTKYLMEAKYFVDALWSTNGSYSVGTYAKSIVITPRNAIGGLLDADIPLVWAMENLNLYFGQNYNVVQYVTDMKTVARYNNSTDLAWNSPWYYSSASYGVTFDEEFIVAPFLAYLTYKGVGNYQSDVQRMYHYLERYRVNHFYPYGDKEYPTVERPDLTLVDMQYIIVAYNYLPSVFNTAHIQDTLNAYDVTDDKGITESSYVGLGALADVALWKGFTIKQRMKTALYQSLMNFEINTTVEGDTLFEGERDTVVLAKGLLFSLAFSGRIATPNYSYGGWTVWYGGYGNGSPTYQLNNTISTNGTNLVGTCVYLWEGSAIPITLWGGIGWDWDAFAYNSTLKYYQGYKVGAGSLSGNDLRVGYWENGKKFQANRTNYNTNPYYPDSLAYEADAVSSPCYLIFVNGTVYSLASKGTRTIRGSNPLAWYEPQSGYLILYRINDNASATMRWKITVSGKQRGLSAIARKFEAIPWIVPAITPTDTAVTNEAKAILSAYASGRDMVRRDFTFSTSSEGSIKWKLKQFSDITVYTDKNMTSSSYDGTRLKFTINAGTGQASTTKIYVGSHANDPKYVSGATSWNRSGNIITVTKVHSSPASILIFWNFPGDIDGDHDVDANDLRLLIAAYGSHVGDPRYNSSCDINWDGNVDDNDLSLLAQNYGKYSS
jgi:hypothetical protein